MSNPERSSYLKVMIQSNYPLRKNSPDGVKEFIVGLEPYLEAKGCKVRLVGPLTYLFGENEYITWIRDHIPFLQSGIPNHEEDENLADYTLGRPFTFSHGKTTHESAVSFNKNLARKLLETVSPDIVDLHEPAAGHVAHTIISASPRRADGILIPCMVAHFHARAEDLGAFNQAYMLLAKAIRRVRFNKYGVPVGFTPGYKNTVFNNLDGRIAVSNATASFWREIAPGDYRVIHNGIDTERLSVEGTKIESWLNDGKKTILFAGRHDIRKGIDDLIKAFALLKSQGREDIKLKITGKGKMTESLRNLVKDFGVGDVEFVGVLPREELIKAYRTADLFVTPAIGGEGFGRTIAESLSCGTPVVATDIDGYREVVWWGHDFAKIAKPRDPEDLARRIAEGLDISEEYKANLKHQAHLYVDSRFAWPVIAQQTMDYYEECLDKHGRTSRNDWPKKHKNGKAQLFNVNGGVIF